MGHGAAPKSGRYLPPEAPDGGVVVRVRATGMCRSDWHAWAGHENIRFPHVPGHELAGEIIAVGRNVRDWRVGDRVTAPFICGCGTCDWCRSGNAQVCPDQEQPGFTHWGSFAEFVELHDADSNLVALPGNVDFATAAALGCRFATAYRAVADRARVEDGEWMVVIGSGGAGLSAIMIGAALGARVIAVDRNPEALDAAVQVGAERTLVSNGIDIPAAVAELTSGGSHVAIDAVGSEQTATDAILSLRRRGRHVQVGLLPPAKGHPRLPMDRVIAWELDLLGSHGMPAVDYPAMLELIGAGALHPQRLIQRTIGLDAAAELLPEFDRSLVAGITVIDSGAESA